MKEFCASQRPFNLFYSPALVGNKEGKWTQSTYSPLPFSLSLITGEHLNVITLRGSKVKSSPGVWRRVPHVEDRPMGHRVQS